MKTKQQWRVWAAYGPSFTCYAENYGEALRLASEKYPQIEGWYGVENWSVHLEFCPGCVVCLGPDHEK